MVRIVCALLFVLALGCPETDDGDCASDPLQPTCISACIASANQNACIGVVDACRAQPAVGRCGDLIQVCVDMPTAIACSGDGDAMVDASDDAGDDAGACGPCAAPTGICNETTMLCVECLAATDCGGTTPFCSPAGRCTECEGHADCSNAGEARCTDVGACEPCIDSTECVGTGQNICEGGNCIECTEDTAEVHCGANSCDPALNTCTETMRGGLEACEACVSDAECEVEHGCVPMDYMGAARGGYCLQDSSGGCERPFSILLMDRTTLSGTAGATYCGINETLATCEAVRGLLDNAMCPGGTDAECAQSGLCRMVGALGNRCSYPCGAASECIDPPTAGNTCGDGGAGGVDYCGG